MTSFTLALQLMQEDYSLTFRTAVISMHSLPIIGTSSSELLSIVSPMSESLVIKEFLYILFHHIIHGAGHFQACLL